MESLLVKFIIAREEARIGRSSGSGKPWTEDKIIQQYRFCNIDRDDDPVTQFIHGKYLGKRPEDFQLINLTIARWSNQPEALQELPVFTSWDEVDSTFVNTYDDLYDAGRKVQNMAYMTWGGHKEFKGRPKHQCFAETTLRDLKSSWANRPDFEFCRLADIAGWMIKAKGLQSFLVNQILTDFKRSPAFEFSDYSTFILPGPGTIRGMNRVSMRDTEAKVDPKEIICELLELRDRLVQDETLPSKIRLCFKDPNNVANTLCEFDKYCRVYFEEGRSPKQKYSGV